MWFHLLTSIVVLENKIVSVADGVWKSVLNCIDRFVAVFNLAGQSLADWSLLLMRYHLQWQRRFFVNDQSSLTCPKTA